MGCQAVGICLDIWDIWDIWVGQGRAKALSSGCKQRVARATGPYRPATRRTERVRRSFCMRRPFPTVRPAPLSRAGSPAGRASGPCHPSRGHAFAIWCFRAPLFGGVDASSNELGVRPQLARPSPPTVGCISPIAGTSGRRVEMGLLYHTCLQRLNEFFVIWHDRCYRQNHQGSAQAGSDRKTEKQ